MTTKIAISLPDELAEAVRRAVSEDRAPSVSAYIADMIRERERAQGLAALLADWDREFGPPSAEDVAWAEQQLGLS
jgi:Arc/MetJ-type ribon-helix-helix transcriptional regulator